MPRPRKHDTHLPRSMFCRRGAYYFVANGKWYPLGREYGSALRKYADFVGSPVRVVTVGDAMAHYLESAKSRLKPATLAGYDYSAANLRAVFGRVALADLTAADVYRYLTEKGNVQANRDRALLSACYTHARRIGALPKLADDPTKGLEYRNPEHPRRRYVTDTELQTLLLAASPKLACIARFIELTGMRQSDALRVRLADIDEEGIRYTQGKTNRPLVVLWSDELRATVETARKLWRRFGREYLFESAPRGRHAARGHGPYTPSGLRALWRVARAKAGLPDVTLHDLRRKSGSDAESDAEAQDRLGHEDGKVTRKHYRAKPKRVSPTR